MDIQSGFTLIELVMVIVILGLLSAFALPRFADLGGEARQSTRQALLGSINSTLGIAKASCYVQDTCSPAGVFQSIEINGQSVSMLGIWPMGRAEGLLRALDTDIPNTIGSNTITFSIAPDCTLIYHHALHRRAPSIGGENTCS